MSRYRAVKRGNGPRAGQLLEHLDDPKRWQVKVFLHRDAKNRKKYYSEVVHGGKKDAKARLLELLQNKASGGLTPRSSMTLRDLAKEWLVHKARDVAPRTLSQYESALERYVLPSLGHRKVCDLSVREIDRLYGQMLEGRLSADDDSPKLSGKPLGARTVRITHAALSQALGQAVRWGITQRNPARDASLPKDTKREKETLTSEERLRFLAECEHSFYGSFFACLLDTGMRPGEACGLRWSDIDFANGRISVRRAVTQGKGGEAILSEPKTKTSRRTIPMVGSLKEVLLAHLGLQQEWGFYEAGFVFTNQSGKPLRPWTFSNGDLASTLTRARITKTISLYSLRHTFATLHMVAGTSMKAVSSVMGHASIQQTGDTYMHSDVSASEHWMKRYEEFLERDVSKPDEILN